MDKVTVTVPDGITHKARVTINGEDIFPASMQIDLQPNALVGCTIELQPELDIDFDAELNVKLKDYSAEDARADADQARYERQTQWRNWQILKRNGYDPYNSAPPSPA